MYCDVYQITLTNMPSNLLKELCEIGGVGQPFAKDILIFISPLCSSIQSLSVVY